MPIRICRRDRTRLIELCDLLCTQAPADGPQILPQLLLSACTDDHISYRRPLQQPVDRNLRHGLAGVTGNVIQCLYYSEEILIWNRRATCNCDLRLHTTGLRQRLAATDLAGEPRPAKRTPDDCAHLVLEPQRHQLPLVVATTE